MAPESARRPAALSLTLGDCAGWLHGTSGETGVLLCSPWGFEELCLRRAWRMLADNLADAGYPTLRFDYPGCGDSLGDPEKVAGLASLVEAARLGADTLRKAGVRRLVIIGQGLGATVAALAAPSVEAEGLALLAPPARGRDYLRELSAWGAMVAETMHLPADIAAPGAVAGFALPDGLRTSLSVANLLDLAQAPAPQVLVAARPGRPGDTRLAERLRQLGAQVAEVAYAGYEAALGNPTAAHAPVDVIAAVTDWMQSRFPAQAGEASTLPALDQLRTATFRETAVRIGPHQLFGVLCEPQGRRRGDTVLLLGSGGDPHVGWARSHVDYARELAAAGVASLRLDSREAGDSPGPLSAEPLQLYDESQVEDALSAVDWLERQGLGPVLPVGRCSGAFMAFHAALRDSRIGRIILVNQRRFIWDRQGGVEAALDKVGHYQRQVRDPLKLLVRWVRGDLNLEAALARLGPAMLMKLRGILGGHRRGLACRTLDAFRTLEKRGVAISMLYCRGGEGHADLNALLGQDGGPLKQLNNVERIWLDGADHGLTPVAARRRLLDLILATALTGEVSAVSAQNAPAEAEDLALGLAAPGGALAA
ncbi:alpha/beta fold hydrolase [Phenylobacterium deserti]|uniref:Serine aminopeptidase S33 domain-containing protein n=1 Tax=Phenylobacterium deserti TaxID=1914756 RepID=A0A328AI85_9CAUL|nr:alpha/beta fold hydrolase [Phenylobacterium deserti]RAK52558.1 hypothetical protein DJ018_10110 [Phenylobacterium deserti]